MIFSSLEKSLSISLSLLVHLATEASVKVLVFLSGHVFQKRASSPFSTFFSSTDAPACISCWPNRRYCMTYPKCRAGNGDLNPVARWIWTTPGAGCPDLFDKLPLSYESLAGLVASEPLGSQCISFGCPSSLSHGGAEANFPWLDPGKPQGVREGKLVWGLQQIGRWC
uniref:Uncharacterized protein n=1 Tax=Molossus molossus TaxID=27622 RepID=A0A7J8I7W6_MOLMO|nr:hypothetical protein HJG59_010530 [Molossus molossus]